MEEKISWLRIEIRNDKKLGSRIEELFGYAAEVLTETSKKNLNEKVEESNKKILLKVRIINKALLSLVQCPKIRAIYNFGGNDNDDENNEKLKSWVVYNEKTGEYYNKNIGLCNDDEKKAENNYFVINYTEKQMEKVTNLKDEYEKRAKGYKEITDHFGIDCESAFCCDVLVARMLAGNFLKYFNGWEHITFEEQFFLNGSFQGGITYCNKGKYNNVTKCDINSAYPFCMQSKTFRMPATVGTITTITEIDKSKLGIYKLNIKGSHFLFKRTDGYYTSYHIEILDLLKIKYELAEGENAIIWDEWITGNDAFDYMNDLYEMKNNGNKYVKGIMNSTWGILSREKVTQIPLEDVTEKMKPFVVSIDIQNFTALVNLDGVNDKVKIPRPYKFVTARIKTFITSYVRMFFIKNILFPLHDQGHKIYQINTDGFITSATKEEIKNIYSVSAKMGDLKIEEEYEKCEIVHIRKINNLS